MSDKKTLDTSALLLRLEAAERKGRGRSILGTAALALALIVVAAPRASSQGVGLRTKPTLDSLQAQINSLIIQQASTNAALTAEVNARTAAVNAEIAARAAADTAESNARTTGDATLTTSVNTLSTTVTTLSTSVTALQTSTAALAAKTQFITVTGTETVFSGTNVSINNGGGTTDTDNGLGNLIVGYNENGISAARTGSHNLVLGTQNGYTSHGGAVFGQSNLISGPYASILGGGSNTASGDRATVSGGFDNAASAIVATVSGGQANSASGGASAISGGQGISVTGAFNWSAGGAFHNP